MDQMPLPFVLEDRKTYDKKSVIEVGAQSGQSEPRQETSNCPIDSIC